MTTEKPKELFVRVISTPNPNAWKFVLDQPVLVDGKANFSDSSEAEGAPLAMCLFSILGVSQIHFFSNIITVTHTDGVNVEKWKTEVTNCIREEFSKHDPTVNPIAPKKSSRTHLPEDIQKIEQILDRTIRPGLQGDGGDIEIVKYEHPQLFVHYQGACGTCPSSTEGTLMAIASILQDEFLPDIEVIPV